MKMEWETPALTFLGTVSELVQGIGKTGTATDGDPSGDFKTGVG